MTAMAKALSITSIDGPLILYFTINNSNKNK